MVAEALYREASTAVVATEAGEGSTPMDPKEEDLPLEDTVDEDVVDPLNPLYNHLKSWFILVFRVRFEGTFVSLRIFPSQHLV